MVYKTQKNRLRLNAEEHRLVTAVCYHSARLYNFGLYSVRQHFFDNNKYLPYAKNYHCCKGNENYKLLLTDTGQQILKFVERDMKSFFSLLRIKKTGKYSEKVKLPRYKDKEGLSLFTVQGRSARIRNGKVVVSFSSAFKREYSPSIKHLEFPFPKNITAEKLQELRVIPKFGGKQFDIEYVYKADVKSRFLDEKNILSIDFGLNNFATCFDSTSGSSFIIDGRYIKSKNQRYNKQKAKLQSIYDRQGYKNTDRMNRLEDARNNSINDYMNRSARLIVEYCKSHNIGTIVWGDFESIKKGCNLGRVNNQNFVTIPYGKFKQKLSSMSGSEGIIADGIEESYTSKCSFFDGEDICKHDSYLGKRVKRGLFRTKKGVFVNSDVNGSANILRKFASKQGIKLRLNRLRKGFVNNPVRVSFSILLNPLQSSVHSL